MIALNFKKKKLCLKFNCTVKKYLGFRIWNTSPEILNQEDEVNDLDVNELTNLLEKF